MKIGLVGWGIETKSAYKYFGKDHTYLIVNEEPASDFPTAKNVEVKYLKKARKPGLTGNAGDLSYLHGIEKCELVISTPVAIKNLEKVYHPKHPMWSKTTTTLRIFFDRTPTKNIIGVTGTKGKGTTATLIGKMLEEAGFTCYIAGNIGIPTLELLDKLNENDWVVLELSNFQLYQFPFSPHIAVHLMVLPEHIDEWHLSMKDYVSAKRNIFNHQTSDDIAIYHPTNKYAIENVAYSKGKHIPYGKKPGALIQDGVISIDDTKILYASEVGLHGAHNLDNIFAAVTAVWQITQDAHAIAKTIRKFKGLEHRLQLVRELDGIRYYDDSFGTTPDTAIVAMDAFLEPKIMIVGGHDKGNDYSDMIKRLTNKDIHHVIGIGITGNRIVESLLARGIAKNKLTYKENFNSWSMREIVTTANKYAVAGEIVLLSTGSASFGIFKDYKERGDLFAKEVNQLSSTRDN